MSVAVRIPITLEEVGEELTSLLLLLLPSTMRTASDRDSSILDAA